MRTRPTSRVVAALGGGLIALGLTACSTGFAAPTSDKSATSRDAPANPEQQAGQAGGRAGQQQPIGQVTPAEPTANAPAAGGPAGGGPAAGNAPIAGKPQVLRVATVAGLSPVVVNAKGRTVYRSDKDKANPPRSNCVGACRQTWQPVLAPNGYEVGEGLEEDLVGVIVQADGGRQLTLNGWPLYYFHKDLKLGQIAGHGTCNDWFAISPIGGPAKRVKSGPSRS
ncbi:hypothetical protein [Plantactinospora sp. GCM10030261]|uniref:hypothetical protein n=1 Tax=Plantactinospora sp. GCM10030261 TaxID=3273420 RepID=UPI00360710FD